jgi:hypothetical protein
VDHLACAIEDELSQHPNFTFQGALNKVYGRFPITGFAAIILEKEMALRIYWRKSIWRTTIANIFSVQGGFLLLALIAIYTILTFLGNMGAIVILGILIIVSLYLRYFVDTMVFQLQTKKEKYLWVKVLFEQSLGSSLLFAIWAAQYMPSIQEWNHAMSPIDFWMFLAVVSFWILGIFQIITVLPHLITKVLIEKYSHLGINISK